MSNVTLNTTSSEDENQHVLQEFPTGDPWISIQFHADWMRPDVKQRIAKIMFAAAFSVMELEDKKDS